MREEKDEGGVRKRTDVREKKESKVRGWKKRQKGQRQWEAGGSKEVIRTGANHNKQT